MSALVLQEEFEDYRATAEAVAEDKDAELARALEGSAALREQLAHAQAANAQTEAVEVLCLPSCHTVCQLLRRARAYSAHIGVFLSSDCIAFCDYERQTRDPIWLPDSSAVVWVKLADTVAVAEGPCQRSQRLCGRRSVARTLAGGRSHYDEQLLSQPGHDGSPLCQLACKPFCASAWGSGRLRI